MYVYILQSDWYRSFGFISHTLLASCCKWKMCIRDRFSTVPYDDQGDLRNNMFHYNLNYHNVLFNIYGSLLILNVHACYHISGELSTDRSASYAVYFFSFRQQTTYALNGTFTVPDPSNWLSSFSPGRIAFVSSCLLYCDFI